MCIAKYAVNSWLPVRDRSRIKSNRITKMKSLKDWVNGSFTLRIRCVAVRHGAARRRSAMQCIWQHIRCERRNLKKEKKTAVGDIIHWSHTTGNSSQCWFWAVLFGYPNFLHGPRNWRTTTVSNYRRRSDSAYNRQVRDMGCMREMADALWEGNTLLKTGLSAHKHTHKHTDRQKWK